MTVDELKAYLSSEGVSFEEKPVQHGTQLRCESGEIFSVYNTGSVVPRGIKSDLTERVLGLKAAKAAPQRPFRLVPKVNKEPDFAKSPTQKDVFIVYGRDTEARDQLELILRRMGMNPIILSQLPAAGDTLIEKLESYIGEKGRVAYACVLITPDDEGYLAGAEDQKKYRARQNVVMELGMVLARLGRKRVALLIKSTVEHPSDLAGLIYIPFGEKVVEVDKQLYQELLNAGLEPKVP